MTIKLFNHSIFAPNKCGTRFLHKAFNFEEFNHLFLPKIDGECYFIIREPIEQLKSALHTELLQYKNSDLFKNRFLNFLSDLGTVHYVKNLYEIIYCYKQKNSNCKIVKLNNLSSLLNDLGYNIPYEKKNYDFSTEYSDLWVNKDTLFNQIKEKYPTQLNVLEEWIAEETLYYNRLINNDIIQLNSKII